MVSVVTERARSLTDLGLAIAQYEAMPDWIRDEPGEQRALCLQEAFVRGLEQMKAKQMGKQFWLEIRVGGVVGRVYRVGRSYVANMFDYAQLLIAKRNNITEVVEQQDGHRRIMVHSGTYRNGSPEYVTVLPDWFGFDIECIEAQMEGARSAYDRRVDDSRVKVFLDRALDGETFRKTPLKDKQHQAIFSLNGDNNGA